MNKYEEKPIPLIIRQAGKKYEVNPEALQFFSSIEGKIAIISVAGIYRTGKSYLLNTILLNQKNGFAVGPTTNPKTKGIWVWGKPLIEKNQHDQIVNVCVLDSEGLGSTEEDINHDLRLLSLTLLLSSTFLYNTLGAIDQNAIDSLGLVLRLCEHLKSESLNDFPDFYWILRDFSLALVGKDNNPLTTKMYLENCLSSQPGDSEVRNKIRASIRSAFVNRNCFTFVRPLTDQSNLQNLDKLELDQLRPEFMEQVLTFKKTIFSNLKTKKIKGKEINASMLNELIQIYVNEINGQKLPVIQTGWLYVCKRECENAMQDLENQIQDIVAKLLQNLPSNKKDLQQEEAKIYEIIKAKFESRTSNNDQALKYLPNLSSILHKKIKKVEEEMKAKNGLETKNFIKKEFQHIQRKLKQNQFKNMGEIVKEFQSFYEFYRKKCPYKDQIQTGLQYLLKKFSDCSLIMFKNMKNKSQSQVAKLKQEIQKLTSQLVLKDQKYKQERTSTQDKHAISQSKIEELLKQNKLMNENVTQLQNQIQRLKVENQDKKNSHNDQIQFEIITIKKKLMEAEDNLKEAQCHKNMEINNIKNMLMLKDNEINHLSEEKDLLSEKLNSISKELFNETNNKKKTNDEFTSELNKIKDQSEQIIKTLKNQLANKESHANKLQNCIESKTNELQTAIKQYETKIKSILQNHEQQKQSLNETYKEEVKSLKEIISSNESELSLKMKKSEAEFAQKQMDLKMHRLSIDKQQAILNQKIEFLKKQCEQKEERIAKLVSQSNYYLSMFQEKDNEVTQMNSVLQELRTVAESSSTELSAKFEQLTLNYNEKIKQIQVLQAQVEKYQNEARQKNQQMKIFDDKIKSLTKNYEQKLKQVNEKLTYEIQTNSKSQSVFQSQLQTLKSENSKSIEEQKRNAELSLVQLKNYYEMERQRLEKRILQERKKHEYTQNSTLNEMDTKHRKTIRSLQQEISQQKSTIESLQEQLTKVENQCELKIMNIEEELQNEQRISSSKYEILEKKYEELCEEMSQFEKNSDEERINFVKKIESLNFEITRKEKELMQSNAKRESTQSALTKKDTQIQNIKKMMTQEIQSSMKKVYDIQTKYQKLNEEYMQLKIESEKEIALSKQRNQFLNTKLTELSKEKQIGSSKNIDKLDKLKINELKEQVEKYKAELMSMQSKLQSNRKSLKQSESNYKKQIMNLQKELQYLTQKLDISESKNSDLQTKISTKNESFMKQHEQMRAKNQIERNEHQKQIESLREKLTQAEDEKSEATWKLQKQTALLQDKIKYTEYQRDQAKKELEENEKRLALAFSQLKKTNDKANEETQAKKSMNQRRFSSQMDMMRESMKLKNQEFEETIKKQKDELKQLKQKNIDLSERLHRSEKSKNLQKNLQDQNEALKREKQALITNYRAQKTKETEEWKRKLTEAQKKNKQIEKANQTFIFTIEKQQTRWSMEKENLLERIKNLEDTIEWQKNKSSIAPKNKFQMRKSDSSTHFSSTSSELSKFKDSKDWK